MDSSALVKRYANETGSLWVRSLTDPQAGHDLFTAHITEIEVVAAIARKIRTRETALHAALRTQRCSLATHRLGAAAAETSSDPGYCLKTTGGPLTRVPVRLTRTSTRSAMWRKGMPWVIPKSLRSKAMVPVIAPDPVPLPERVRCRVSGLETPRMVNVPGTSKV